MKKLVIQYLIIIGVLFLAVSCSPQTVQPSGGSITNGGKDKTDSTTTTAAPTEVLKPIPPEPPVITPPSTVRVPSREVRSWKAHLGSASGLISEIAFTPDGQLLASGSFDKTIKLWQVNTGQLLRILTRHEGEVYSVAFSPDGQRLVSSSYDKTLKLWQVSTGQLLKTLTGHEGAVYSVAFSPDGQLLVSSSHDRTIKLWQMSTGQLLKTLRGHENGVPSVAFSPNGQQLGSDHQIVEDGRYASVAYFVRTSRFCGYCRLQSRRAIVSLGQCG